MASLESFVNIICCFSRLYYMIRHNREERHSYVYLCRFYWKRMVHEIWWRIYKNSAQWTFLCVLVAWCSWSSDISILFSKKYNFWPNWRFSNRKTNTLVFQFLKKALHKIEGKVGPQWTVLLGCSRRSPDLSNIFLKKWVDILVFVLTVVNSFTIYWNRRTRTFEWNFERTGINDLTSYTLLLCYEQRQHFYIKPFAFLINLLNYIWKRNHGFLSKFPYYYVPAKSLMRIQTHVEF